MFRPRRPSPGSPRQQPLKKTAASDHPSGYSRTVVPCQNGSVLRSVPEDTPTNNLTAAAQGSQSNRTELLLNAMQKPTLPWYHRDNFNKHPQMQAQGIKSKELITSACATASRTCCNKDNGHPDKEKSNVTYRTPHAEAKKRPASGNSQFPSRSQSAWKEWPGNTNVGRSSPKCERSPYKIPKLDNTDTGNRESGGNCSGKAGSNTNSKSSKDAKKRHIKVMDRYLVLRRPQGVWKDWDDDDKINTIRWFGAHPEDLTPETVAKWQMPEAEMWPFFGDGAWQMPSVRMELWLRPVQSEIVADKLQSTEGDNRTAEVFNWDSVDSEVRSGGSDL